MEKRVRLKVQGGVNELKMYALIQTNYEIKKINQQQNGICSNSEKYYWKVIFRL